MYWVLSAAAACGSGMRQRHAASACGTRNNRNLFNCGSGMRQRQKYEPGLRKWNCELILLYYCTHEILISLKSLYPFNPIRRGRDLSGIRKLPPYFLCFQCLYPLTSWCFVRTHYVAFLGEADTNVFSIAEHSNVTISFHPTVDPLGEGGKL